MLLKKLLQQKFSPTTYLGNRAETLRKRLTYVRRNQVDRRSSIKPNRSGYSRRINIVDRRKPR